MPGLDGPMRDLKVLLIGGTSSVGKSTLAEALGARLGWTCTSTDRLGRHPGRPWKVADRLVPPHVTSHYSAQPVADLTTEQLRHYERMWPAIESLVRAHGRENGPGRLIIEGSGVWPDRAAGVTGSTVAGIWLTASAETLRERIYSASRYSELTGHERFLVDQFVGRTERYNEIMLSAVRRLELPLVDVDSAPSLDGLLERCVRLLG
jgi:2-phosphoglycerate kinase